MLKEHQLLNVNVGQCINHTTYYRPKAICQCYIIRQFRAGIIWDFYALVVKTNL